MGGYAHSVDTQLHSPSWHRVHHCKERVSPDLKILLTHNLPHDTCFQLASSPVSMPAGSVLATGKGFLQGTAEVFCQSFVPLKF